MMEMWTVGFPTFCFHITSELWINNGECCTTRCWVSFQIAVKNNTLKDANTSSLWICAISHDSNLWIVTMQSRPTVRLPGYQGLSWMQMYWWDLQCWWFLWQLPGDLSHNRWCTVPCVRVSPCAYRFVNKAFIQPRMLHLACDICHRIYVHVTGKICWSIWTRRYKQHSKVSST